MRVVSLLAAAGLIASSVQALPLQLNGWYPCSTSTADGGFNATSPSGFECAGVRVPLCHEGICESDKEIELFVRRLLGRNSSTSSTSPNEPRKALWLLQGGPGASSVVLEGHMLLLAKLLGSEVDLYTTDHRGTGRSNFLECKAAQAFSPGSPSGVDPDFEEIPNCIRDILFEIDNKTEAFSVTSAAKDLVYLTGNLYPTSVRTFVYGVSYGTYFTERIMHLAPKHVRGYIIDGVVPEDNPSFTTTNADRVPPAKRLAEACEKDVFCSSKFKKEIKAKGSVYAAWRAVYEVIDMAAPGTNKCAEVLRKAYPDASSPSLGLRNFLGGFAPDMDKRLAIPAIFYRINRCEDRDVAFLSDMTGTSEPDDSDDNGKPVAPKVTEAAPTAYDQVGGSSEFLGSLIKVSEMWTNPAPSWDDELKEFEKGLFPASMEADYSWYCYLTTEFNTPACANLRAKYPKLDFAKLKESSPRFTYKPDAYWHKFATIPKNASVLVVNGKMDFQTLSDGGVREYENLKSDDDSGQKMLVEFEFGGHGVGLSSTTFSDTTFCGFRIIASFVAQDGETAKVNTTCMDTLPDIDFEDLMAFQSLNGDLTSVEAFYEGEEETGDDEDEQSTRQV